MATSLSSTDQAFLQRVVRFLVNVLSPIYVAKARREGYDGEEHALGWSLWRTAAGETRPFDHWLREQQAANGPEVEDAEQRRLLQEIDEFENTWFPRTRAIIRRAVPRERREAFAAAFFKDLAQQPLGPAVVGSVGTYVTRLQGLDGSSEPDATAVRAMLRKRGLTKGRLADIKRLLEAAQRGLGPAKKEPSAVSAEELEQARVAQLQALADLRDWFNDWGTTLRSRFGARDQLRLGLTLFKARGTATDELDDDAQGDDAQGDDDALDGDGPASASA